MAKKKEEEFRFLLVGKSGSGKSSTGNTIFGEDLFVKGFGLASGTKTCESRRSTKPKKGVVFKIVDTPGLFDPTRSNEDIAEEIIKASAYLHPGPHAILYVLQIDRYTPEERDTFLRLKELFDASIVKFTIIIFTRGDELKKKKMTLEALLEQADKPFKEVLRECENRVLVFNNEDRGKRDKQVNQLLEMVRKIVKANDEKSYSCTVQDVVNTELERKVTVRVNQKIERDPNLKKVFNDKARQAREAKERVEKQHKDFQESLLNESTIEKKIQEQLEEKRMKEEKEREHSELQRKEEGEEKEIKRKEEEDKTKLEELQGELEKMKRKNKKVKEKREQERRNMEEYERKLQEERKKLEEEEMRKLKDDIAAGKEKTWMVEVADGLERVAGGLWKAAKGWFGV